MICKVCGTEGRGCFCSHCGSPLVNDAFAEPTAPTPEQKEQETVPAAVAPTEGNALPTTPQPTEDLPIKPQADVQPTAETQPEEKAVPAESLQPEAEVKPKEEKSEAEPAEKDESDESKNKKKDKKRKEKQKGKDGKKKGGKTAPVRVAPARRHVAPKANLANTMVPALLLLLPLLYLVVNGFSLYTPHLYDAVEGANTLQLLWERFLSDTFATSPVGDIVSGTYGTGVVLVHRVSALTVLRSGFAYPDLIAPASALLCLAGLCALCGLAVLLTGGRILRAAWGGSLVLACGTLGSLSPFVAGLALRVQLLISRGSLAAADEALGYVHFSLELLLLFAVVFFLFGHNLHFLRTIADGAQKSGMCLALPCRIAARSFGLSRVLAAVFGALAVIVTVCLLFLPVFNSGALFSFVTAAFAAEGGILQALRADWQQIGSMFVTADPLGAAHAFVRFFGVLLAAITLLLLCHAVYGLVKLLLVKEKRVATGKRSYGAVRRAGKRFARPVRLMLITYVSAQVYLFIYLFFFTNVRHHFKLFPIDDTLTLSYSVLMMARSFIAPTVLGMLLLLVCLLLGNAARGFAFAMLSSAGDKENS